MTLATRGMGSPNLIPTSGLGNYGDVVVVVRKFKGGNSSAKKELFELFTQNIENRIENQDLRVNPETITAKQVVSLLDKKIISETVKEIKRELDIMAPEARQILEQRAEKQIEAVRNLRVTELNQETIAMMLIAVIADE